MRLPGQLKDTTLGDLLGALHRENADGSLELIEPLGRVHRIELRRGKVEHVETESPGPRLGDLLDLAQLPELAAGQRLGETLLQRGIVSKNQLHKALRTQNLSRLELLFSLKDAAIRFRAPRPFAPDPTAPSSIEKNEFLAGRPRSRSKNETQPSARKAPVRCSPIGSLRVLGLESSASSTEIRQAFRTLAAEYHPDRYPDADRVERLRLFLRFSEISRAYHLLTG